MTWSSPVVALLTGETLEVVDVVACSHHHLEGWDHLVAGGAVASAAKQPEGEADLFESTGAI